MGMIYIFPPGFRTSGPAGQLCQLWPLPRYTRNAEVKWVTGVASNFGDVANKEHVKLMLCGFIWLVLSPSTLVC